MGGAKRNPPKYPQGHTTEGGLSVRHFLAGGLENPPPFCSRLPIRVFCSEKRLLGGLLLRLVQSDIVAKALEPVDMVFDQLLRVQFVEEVTAKIPIFHLGL